MGKTKTAFIGGEAENEKNKEKHDRAHKGEAEKIHVAGLKGGQRVKVVEASPTEEVATDIETKDKKGGRTVVEKVRSKKYQDAKAKIEVGKAYPLAAAVKLVKETSYSKFDGTVELHLVLKKVGSSAQVSLPFAAGRAKKVEVASDETIKKLTEGKIDFDILVATPDMMPKLVPFAKVLGPKGLMPNPKNGTLVPDPKKAASFSTGTVLLKTEKEAPLVHTVIGKNSQKDEETVANLESVLKAFGGEKQIVRGFIKSSMSPSVKLQIA
jgi:large subunit ribosomal protein L1